MLSFDEINVTCWSFSIYVILIISICALMMLGSFFLGSKATGRAKEIPYESGINSVGSARLRLSAKFYLVAMFFVIFDVESLYLYAWSVSIKEVGWFGFIEASIFILILLISLLYLVRVRALEWAPFSFNRVSTFNGKDH